MKISLAGLPFQRLKYLATFTPSSFHVAPFWGGQQGQQTVPSEHINKGGRRQGDVNLNHTKLFTSNAPDNASFERIFLQARTPHDRFPRLPGRSACHSGHRGC